MVFKNGVKNVQTAGYNGACMVVSSVLALEATELVSGNSNGSWTDKYLFHFSTAKEMSVKATFFFM